MMEYEATIQSVLDNIDRRITENIRIDELARTVNYSAYHFCRIFAALTGTPVMSYVIHRKLEYAQYDLSQGRRIIDVAMDYGFDTHAGFTKAFKKCFGFPPSLCHLHIAAKPPEKATVGSVKLKHGGLNMTPYIIVMTPFTVKLQHFVRLKLTLKNPTPSSIAKSVCVMTLTRLTGSLPIYSAGVFFIRTI